MASNPAIVATVSGQLVNGAISFTVPSSLSAGQYLITVVNANGASNRTSVTLETGKPLGA